MEKELARRLKGWITPGSGNQSIKGDVQTAEYLLEAKWRSAQTTGNVYYLDLLSEWLTKVDKQAKARGKEPILAVCIANLDTYCIVRFDYWNSCDGKIACCDIEDLGVLDKKQLRLRSDIDWSYKVVAFGNGDRWVFVPENDFIFLVNQERGKEGTCRRKKKAEKTPEQQQREQEWKEKQKQRRKAHYKRQKELRKTT